MPLSPAVSIIVSVYRRETFLRTLESLRRQSTSETFEVLLVFDGPPPDAWNSFAPSQFPFPLYEERQEHEGAAAARNRGAQSARGDLLLFLDDDIVADSRLVEEHIQCHEQERDSVLAFGPVGTDPSSPATFLSQWMDDWKRDYFRRAAAGLPTDPFPFCSANFSISRLLFLRTGGFDPAFRGYGWEEADLGIRLQKEGIRCVYVPKAECYELYVKPPEEAAGSYATRKGANEVRFIRKHPSFRGYSSIREAFEEKMRIRWWIRAAWKIPFLCRLLIPWLPGPQRRFRARSLYNFWRGVHGTGICWDEISRLFDRSVTIVGYHDIPETVDPRSWLDVPFRTFARQLRRLVKSGYTAISFEEFLQWRNEGKDLPKRAVILTFDDGYRSFGSRAAGLLSELGLKATVFISTGMIGKANEWDLGHNFSRKELMDTEELKSVRRRFDLGGHGTEHRDLTGLSTDALVREIRSCFDWIATAGSSPLAFSYPYGFVNRNVEEGVRQAGFSCAVTTIEGTNNTSTDLFGLRRVLITQSDSLAGFLYKISTGGTFAAKFRMRLRRWHAEPQAGIIQE